MAQKRNQKKMKHPTTVTVISRVFPIEEWDHDEADRANMFGRTTGAKQTIIQIDRGLDDPAWALTLHHEITHLIFMEMGLNIQGKMLAGLDEEDVVLRLSNGWAAVYRANPELLDFFGLHLR